MVRDSLLAWVLLSVPLSVLIGRMIGSGDAEDHRSDQGPQPALTPRAAAIVGPAGSPPTRRLVGVAGGRASSR